MCGSVLEWLTLVGVRRGHLHISASITVLLKHLLHELVCRNLIFALALGCCLLVRSVFIQSIVIQKLEHFELLIDLGVESGGVSLKLVPFDLHALKYL